MNKNVKRFDKPKGNVNNSNAASAWEAVFGKLAILGMGIASVAVVAGWTINVFRDVKFRKQQFNKVAKNG